ncbi:unnamed protein product [Rotaria sp. Silwood1]|nr:unnamed protein product [Rotaria sp. Silwood1]
MEEKLNDIDEIFQSGQHKEAIAKIRTMIEESSTDNSLYKTYDILGKYLNSMGQHMEAVQAWEDGLRHLETSVERFDELGNEKIIDWINISLQTARLVHRLGTDGPGVSYKSNRVCYAPSKMTDAEQAEWKIEQFQSAVRHYKGVLEHIPEGNTEIKRKIQLELARVLFDLKQFDEAVKIYEDGFCNDGDPVWLYKAAECLWQQDKKEQAYTRLQQLIGTDSTFADAYGMLATYFNEKNDTASADESMRKYKFYSWIPSFCRHIECNPENLAIVEELNSDRSLECVNTTLVNDKSRRSTEFLAAICYHHYHGLVENKAFEELEKRGKVSEGDERDFIGSTLMHLIKNHQSVCTVKGAANALAEMKYENIFDVLERLLPQDVNPFFPMDIPKALGKLGDSRAIPLLIKIIENPMRQENDDSDSSDEIFSSGGKDRLVVESCLALASFINDEKAKEVLMNGINNEQTREACLAVLCLCTDEKQYFDELEKMLAQGDSLDYRVKEYLNNNDKKSHYVDQLLMLNEEIRTKTAAQKNDDDNE